MQPCYDYVLTAKRNASMFSVETSGGMPLPQDRIIRLTSATESRAALVLSRTSSGVPTARTTSCRHRPAFRFTNEMDNQNKPNKSSDYHDAPPAHSRPHTPHTNK